MADSNSTKSALADAMKKLMVCKSFAKISISDLCDKLTSAMTKIEVEGVTGNITWSADGEPTKEPKGMVIEDGSYKALD